jgi:hypothetical protein
MVIHPVCRQGLEMDALAKQTFFAPSLAYSEVSIISALMYCRYGWSAGPSGVVLISCKLLVEQCLVEPLHRVSFSAVGRRGD